ncbi:mucin-1 [Apiospora arundinis]
MFADQSGRPASSAGRSPGLTLNLSSNNPFRNRAASPNGSSSFSPPPPHSPFDDPPPRPVSRNPFLDPNSNNNITPSFPVDRIKSPDSMASKDGKSPTAEELFDNLTLEEKNGQKAPLRPMNKPPPGGPPRGENMPPRGRGPPPRGGPPSPTFSISGGSHESPKDAWTTRLCWRREEPARPQARRKTSF